MVKNSFNDEYGELLLRKAAILLCEEDEKIYDKLQNDESIFNPNQEELDEKILGMIKIYEKKEKKRRNRIRLRKITSRAAIFISIIMISLAITFTTVEAFRITVLNLIIEQGKKYSLISLSENDNIDLPKELYGIYYPYYLPDGYKIKNTFVSDGLVEITFVNINNDVINYSYFDKNAKTGIDTENTIETKVLINGLEGSIFSKDEHRILVFRLENNLFIIEGNITQEEIIKVGENIKK